MDWSLPASVALPLLSRFFNCPMNSISWIAFGTASNYSCLSDQLLLVYNNFWYDHNLVNIH